MKRRLEEEDPTDVLAGIIPVETVLDTMGGGFSIPTNEGPKEETDWSSFLPNKDAADQFVRTKDAIIVIDSKQVTTGDGFLPVCLGFVYGMQYNKRGPTECYETIMLNLLTLDEMITYGAQIYLP